MRISYVDLGSQWAEIETEALNEISRILRGGKAIGDPIVEKLEAKLANDLGVRHCISLNSGTDALLLGLMSLKIGREDEVITVANSFIASTAAIAHVGARPIFVDVGDDHLINTKLIEAAVTNKTKAIMPVHLEGKMCNMVEIKRIADKYGLAIIEDAAQSFGSSYSGYKPGQLSNLACFSFHPLKNLNAIGDGGFISTNDNQIAQRLKNLRNHGLIDRETSTEFGFVSRLDSIQAAILYIRLKGIQSTIEKRKQIADRYTRGLLSCKVKTPVFDENCIHTYHLYVIEVESRDYLQRKLKENGIDTKIHYPKLICDQPAYITKFGICNLELSLSREQSKRILSLPVHQNLKNEQIDYIIECIKSNVS